MNEKVCRVLIYSFNRFSMAGARRRVRFMSLLDSQSIFPKTLTQFIVPPRRISFSSANTEQKPDEIFIQRPLLNYCCYCRHSAGRFMFGQCQSHEREREKESRIAKQFSSKALAF